MNRLSVPCWFWLIGMLAVLLTGCTLDRPAGTVDDIDAFVPPVAVAQANGAVIRLQPATQQLNLGDITAIEIRLDNVVGLVAADIQLQFNPGVLQAQDTDPNQDGIQVQPGDFLAADFVVANEVNNETGLAHYALTQVGSTPPVDGSGLLATITFRAIAEGNSQLAFTLNQLANGDGQDIPVNPQTGQVTVGQPTGEPPTVTFTPTSTPTPGTDTPTPTPTFTPSPGEDTPTPTFTPVQPTLTPTVSPTPTPAPLPPTSTPIPLKTEIPPGATLGHCYRVKEGDTLYSLGQQFGVNPHHINLANDLHPPGYIFVHQALFIPTEMGRGPNFYVVQADGETLTSIAEQCHLPVSFLASVNGGLPENAILQAGHVLCIPIPPFPPPSRLPYPPPGPPRVMPPPCYGPCR